MWSTATRTGTTCAMKRSLRLGHLLHNRLAYAGLQFNVLLTATPCPAFQQAELNAKYGFNRDGDFFPDPNGVQLRRRQGARELAQDLESKALMMEKPR